MGLAGGRLSSLGCVGLAGAKIAFYASSQDEALLQSKKSEVESQHESHQELMRRVKETEDAVTAAQKHFQAVSAGLSSSADGQDQTLAAQKIGTVHSV